MDVIGIDEVGRGCWAGPLVAGAVFWPAGLSVPQVADWRLADSKKLSLAQRRAAVAGLRGLGVAYGLGWVSNQEIDALGMTACVALAMRRAYAAVGQPADAVIIDGSYNYLADIAGSRAVVKADDSVPAVSAASILAKVARDDWMAEMALAYPGYGFERHVGYGTRLHMEALQSLGPCSLHRRSFRPVAAMC